MMLIDSFTEKNIKMSLPWCLYWLKDLKKEQESLISYPFNDDSKNKKYFL